MFSPLQLFTASVVTGSSVRYTWIIDDLVQFPHIGESYSVVFKKPAEYALKVNMLILKKYFFKPLCETEPKAMIQ